MRHITVLSIFILGLFLIGCIQVSGIPGTEKEYVCADGKTIVKDIAQCPAVSGAAAIETDPEMKVCEEMPEVENMPFADSCYMGLAYKRENSTLCKKVSQNNKANCYLVIAMLKNDASLCDGAGSQKSQCYMSYATNKADITACDKISDVNMKDGCYQSYATKVGDISICNKITVLNQKDNCYYSIAQQRCDVSICNSITNANMKQQCTNNLQYCSGQGQSEQPKEAKPVPG